MSPNESIHKSVGWDYMNLQAKKDKYHLLLLGILTKKKTK